MRWIVASAAVAITGVGILTFDALPTEAVVFSVGPAENGLTNDKCMDVSGNSITSGTPVIVFDCHAGPNQQFQWAGFTGKTIFTVGGQLCLDVRFQAITEGTPLQSVVCRLTGTRQALAQEFSFENGQIIYLKPRSLGRPDMCVDAGDMQNGTQLVVNNCKPNTPSQQWQIKEAIFSVGPPDGSIGNFKCMEVAGNDLGSQIPGDGISNVDMVPSDCHAGPSEQFQFAGQTIYAESGHRCLQLDLATAITPLTGTAESAECAPGIAQEFSYSEGRIINSVVPATPLCLEANTGSTLVFNPCESGNDGQQWQIK